MHAFDARKLGGHQGPEQEVRAEQIGDRHAGEDGVGEGVTEEGHGAQHDEAADDRAHYPDDERGDQGALHELEREGVGEPGDQRGSACGSWLCRCASPSPT